MMMSSARQKQEHGAGQWAPDGGIGLQIDGLHVAEQSQLGNKVLREPSCCLATVDPFRVERWVAVDLKVIQDTKVLMLSGGQIPDIDGRRLEIQEEESELTRVAAAVGV